MVFCPRIVILVDQRYVIIKPNQLQVQIWVLWILTSPTKGRRLLKANTLLAFLEMKCHLLNACPRYIPYRLNRIIHSMFYSIVTGVLQILSLLKNLYLIISSMFFHLTMKDSPEPSTSLNKASLKADEGSSALLSLSLSMVATKRNLSGSDIVDDEPLSLSLGLPRIVDGSADQEMKQFLPEKPGINT